MGNVRRWAVLALLVLSLGLALFYRQNPVTMAAQAYAEEVATASAATYVSLRVLNAFLSTAQEIELGGSLGVSANARPLKILEPIDDTIERIAGLIFGVMVATGVLAVAMGPVSAVGSALVALAAAVWLVQLRGGGMDGLARKMVSYGVFLGLALPVAFVLTAQVANRMTDAVYDRHTEVIAHITDSVGANDLAADEGIWREVDRYRTLATSIYAEADTLIQSYIAILAVYAFRIFVLPLLILGGFFVLARHFARPHP
jgi:hypothetical protein